MSNYWFLTVGTHIFEYFFNTQLEQKVHSYVHIQASVESEGKFLSQYSQFGRSSKMFSCW